jgi:D-tyrosyl-tRNA(Tyr) deacylase
LAQPLYDAFCLSLTQKLGTPTERGEFGAHMDVHLTNDGPVTLFMDTKNKA